MMRKKVLGAIAVIYNYKSSDDKEALYKKAEMVRYGYRGFANRNAGDGTRIDAG
jgi:hypothetical protein